jgi:hypothetical protein
MNLARLAAIAVLALGLGTPAVAEVHRLGAGDDLAAALERAQRGDEIVLEAGATYTGPFDLPPKSGEGWITIRSSELDRGLPPAGQRVDPSHAKLMPKLESAADSVLRAGPRSGGYRFVGLEIRPAAGQFLQNVVLLGHDATTLDDVPGPFAFDRCYIHGDAKVGSRRGLALNSSATSVEGCYLSDFKEVGADSQAIGGWNGPGPFRIVNNHLEGAGENVMFGGADPAIEGLVPSDIVIRGNLLTKPVEWRDGARWSVKNILELKNARRVAIEDNVLENCWAAGQNGFAVLLTPRNQDGKAPWSTVEDVKIEGNIIRGAGGGVNILGHDDAAESGRLQRVAILGNLFLDIDGKRWGGPGTLFQILSGTQDLAIERNVAFHSGHFIMADGEPNRRFVFRSNLVSQNELGLVGSGAAPGVATLERYFPGSTFRDNVIVGGNKRLYPRGNQFRASADPEAYRDFLPRARRAK